MDKETTTEIFITQKRYLKDTYLFESTAKLLKVSMDKKGIYFIFDSTIFHPQGGGQPCDVGTITCDNVTIFHITFVAKENGFILHYIEGVYEVEFYNQFIGKVFLLLLDKEKRIINAKNHTAGHLLGCIVECIDPSLKKIKGYHFPDGPNLEYFGKELCVSKDVLASKIEEIANNCISKGAEVEVYELKEKKDEDQLRMVHIKGFECVPCGGTHLRNVNELKELRIRKIVFSKGDLRIGYNVL